MKPQGQPEFALAIDGVDVSVWGDILEDGRLHHISLGTRAGLYIDGRLVDAEPLLERGHVDDERE